MGYYASDYYSERNYITCCDSPLGLIFLGSRGEGLAGLWLVDQLHFGEGLFGPVVERSDLPVFVQTRAWLDDYFAGRFRPLTELPLDAAGSPFRQAVWRLLWDIPLGEVTTYKVLAQRLAAGLGRERIAPQAIGGAIAYNPISIIVPCHRVVGTSGSLTGYAGGLDRKLWLLNHEGVDTSRFFWPE